MEYKYFTLDKNPKQFKRISIGEYSIELRIEWNTRSKAWYVLGYSGDEIVISNVKLTPNQLYSIDIDSEYDLPYMIGIIPKYTNYDWDTETTFLIVDNPLSNAVEGLTVDGGVIKRSIATSSDTHSRKALKGTENKYLFDVVSITQETGIIIICNGADASFKTVNLPQGRWDFTINGMRTITADTQAFRSLMNDYGVQIVDVGNNEYLWANNSDYEIKIEGLYPYAAGYDFNVAESSNESAKIHSVDNNGWVNRFTVCLTPFVDTVWEVYKTEVSEDYNNLVFKGRKSLTGVKPSEEEALLEKYKSRLDVYSSTIVNELTGVSDWILDSDNNQIKYTEVKDDTGSYFIIDGKNYYTSDLSSACTQYATSIGDYYDSTLGTAHCALRKGGRYGSMYYVAAGLVVGEPVEEQKTLPLSTVVAQVISNAANGDVNAEELLNSLNKYDSYAEVEILPLIVDQYKQGIDVYSATIVNELTGVSDWVLDPVNNQIKYKDPSVPVDPNDPSVEFLYHVSTLNGPNETSPEAACRSAANEVWQYLSYSSSTKTCGYGFYGSETDTKGFPVYVVANPAYDPNVEREEKYLPLETVAQQVISKAKSGNIDAQKVALSAALSPSLVSSLSDSDMQQWQAVKDAIGELTGATEWTFDNVNKVVRHAVINPDLNAVASTLTQRYLKNPNEFVGKDAFTALIESVGWVIGEGGTITKKPTPEDQAAVDEENAKYLSPTQWRVAQSIGGRPNIFYSYQSACAAYLSYLQTFEGNSSLIGASSTGCSYRTVYANGNSNNSGVTLYSSSNQNYNPNYVPSEPSAPVATNAEIETAVKNALESNNPDLTAAISDAITAAYAYDVVGFNELYDSLSVTYQQVADKIIANSIAEDQGVSLLAEAYIQESLRKFTDVDSQLNSNIYNFGVKDVIIEHVDGGIKSTWVSFGFPENVSYYRSNTTMNPDNMPSSLNTGLKDLNSFTEQVVVSAREYIRFGTIKNNHEVISEEFIIEPPLSLLTDINFEVIEI